MSCGLCYVTCSFISILFIFASFFFQSRMLNRKWSERKVSASTKQSRGRQELRKRPPVNNSSPTRLAALTPPSNAKYVLAMVGLPARGKSYIVKMIMRYLRWTGIKSEIFNVSCGSMTATRGS